MVQFHWDLDLNLFDFFETNIHFKKKTKKQTFQSHIVNDWESLSPVMASEATEDIFMDQINEGAASFQSHINKGSDVDNLIQL